MWRVTPGCRHSQHEEGSRGSDEETGEPQRKQELKPNKAWETMDGEAVAKQKSICATPKSTLPFQLRFRDHQSRHDRNHQAMPSIQPTATNKGHQYPELRPAGKTKQHPENIRIICPLSSHRKGAAGRLRRFRRCCVPYCVLDPESQGKQQLKANTSNSERRASKGRGWGQPRKTSSDRSVGIGSAQLLLQTRDRMA
jgi:hypothetical protein